jgi:large subunit ribosomal protein L9
MKVILVKNVEKLGKEGDALEVKEGYARNFLIPRGFALEATKESLKKIDEIKRKKTKLEEQEKEKASELREKIEKLSLTIRMEVKEAEEIYGSITEVQILKSLKEEGIELNKGKITLEEPIKKLGVYNIKAKLHAQVEANLRVWVVKK